MGSTWRYPHATRTHALECFVDNLDDVETRALLEWLQATAPAARYRVFHALEDDAIRYLSTSPSSRRRKFKNQQERIEIVAAASWYGKIAWQYLQDLEEHGGLHGGPSYRVVTAWAARRAVSLLTLWGVCEGLLVEVLPRTVDFPEQLPEGPDNDPDRYERLFDRCSYDLG